MPWTAVSSDSWITITNGSSGINAGTINCTISANTSNIERTGTITITAEGALNSPMSVSITQAEGMEQSHTITASVNGIGGTISPSGATTVNHSANQEFTIIPNNGYIIGEVLVDSEVATSQVVNNVYTFTNVIADHTIVVSFTGTNVSLDLNNIVSIYPNPVNDILNISSNEIINTIEVINITGQKLINKAINEINTKLDLSNLAEGNYLIKITTNNNVTTKLFNKIK